MRKGSDLLVAALENEGVDRIFGVPGEENLDVVESLRNSSIKLILCGLYGRDLRPSYREARRVYHHARPWCTKPDDRSSLRTAWRNAHDHAHRAKGHHEQPPGKVPNRGCGECIQAAYEAFSPNRQHKQYSHIGSRRFPHRHGRTARTCLTRAA